MSDNDEPAPAPAPSALAVPSHLPPDPHPATAYLASLSAGSRATMQTALNSLAALLDIPAQHDAAGRDVRYLAVAWHALSAEQLSTLQAKLQARYAPATANKALAALRRVCQEARRLGQMSAESYETIAAIPGIPVPRDSRSRVLSTDDMVALMRACAEDSTAAGARDAAILALLLGAGLRRGEVTAIDHADYDRATGVLQIASTPRKKARTTYVVDGPKAALDAWLRIRGDAPGPLFYGITRGGRLVARRLAAQAVAVICAARTADAGIDSFTPHDMRHTFISGLLDAGADIAVVQRLVGHEDPATTARYDRRGEEAQQQAMTLMHVPYISPH